MGFNYRQVIGSFIWPMIKARPDICFHTTKMSQFMANPAKIHYECVRHIGRYLAHTIDDGIYFWHESPRMDLPEHPLPSLYPENHTLAPLAYETNRKELCAFADSDWATCKQTRNAISGAVIMLAGGAIGYKTRVQRTNAHSSTTSGK
jgi:hypothetical protein